MGPLEYDVTVYELQTIARKTDLVGNKKLNFHQAKT